MARIKQRKAMTIELGNRSGQIGFVFISNLNGLRIPQLESNSFIKRVEKTLICTHLIFKRVDSLNPFKIQSPNY